MLGQKLEGLARLSRLPFTVLIAVLLTVLLTVLLAVLLTELLEVLLTVMKPNRNWYFGAS